MQKKKIRYKNTAWYSAHKMMKQEPSYLRINVSEGKFPRNLFLRIFQIFNFWVISYNASNNCENFNAKAFPQEMVITLFIYYFIVSMTFEIYWGAKNMKHHWINKCNNWIVVYQIKKYIKMMDCQLKWS